MKCPFCAEEIQDAAILCRFCGAEKRDGQWCRLSPSPPADLHRKGNFTIKTAGILFLASGTFTLFSLTSEVALLGAMRGGVTALCYNLFFAALFFSMGIGLMMGKPCGYKVVLAGTLLYSIDRLLFVMDKNTRDAYLAASGVTSQVEALIDSSMLDQLIIFLVLTMLACWWGFALYIHLRRDYFQPSAEGL